MRKDGSPADNAILALEERQNIPITFVPFDNVPFIYKMA
jgi:hypothetical protein